MNTLRTTVHRYLQASVSEMGRVQIICACGDKVVEKSFELAGALFDKHIEDAPRALARSLTLRDVGDLVAGVESAAQSGDFEAAHSLEDGLHRLVLLAIVEQNGAGSAFAREALKTTKLDFLRACA